MLQDEPRIYVESEDEPHRMLLETKISKDDGYQKQQGEWLELILWKRRPNGENRHPHRVDRIKWDGHGAQLSRGGWLRSHMVR